MPYTCPRCNGGMRTPNAVMCSACQRLPTGRRRGPHFKGDDQMVATVAHFEQERDTQRQQSRVQWVQEVTCALCGQASAPNQPCPRCGGMLQSVA